MNIKLQEMDMDNYSLTEKLQILCLANMRNRFHLSSRTLEKEFMQLEGSCLQVTSTFYGASCALIEGDEEIYQALREQLNVAIELMTNMIDKAYIHKKNNLQKDSKNAH